MCALGATYYPFDPPLNVCNGSRIFLRFERTYNGEIFEPRAQIEDIIVKSLHPARKVNI
jgi:hypothetical protein